MSNILKNSKFEKVSFAQFLKDYTEIFGNIPEEKVREIYDSIKLPKRATKYSAGYDFFMPIDVIVNPGVTVKIPTGIRCKMPEDFVLELFPRSSLGFKYRLQLNNTVGIIDSDYYNAKNEGHIMAKITNDSNEGKTVELDTGSAFMQGIFTKYYILEDDSTTEERVGGFGSTNK